MALSPSFSTFFLQPPSLRPPPLHDTIKLSPLVTVPFSFPRRDTDHSLFRYLSSLLPECFPFYSFSGSSSPSSQRLPFLYWLRRFPLLCAVFLSFHLSLKFDIPPPLGSPRRQLVVLFSSFFLFLFRIPSVTDALLSFSYSFSDDGFGNPFLFTRCCFPRVIPQIGHPLDFLVSSHFFLTRRSRF